MSSQAHISLETSLSFPTSSDASHSSSVSSETLASTPSLYVTFKVLQLVNTFRKRVKTRGQTARSPKKETSERVAHDFCQSFERQAFEEIDRYLGRKTVRPSSRRGKTATADPQPSEERGLPPLNTTALEEQAPAKSIDW